MLWPTWDRSLIRSEASELIVDSKNILHWKTQLSAFRGIRFRIGVVWLFYCTTSQLILQGLTSGDIGFELVEFTFCITDVGRRLLFMMFLYCTEGAVFIWVILGKKPYAPIMFWIQHWEDLWCDFHGSYSLEMSINMTRKGFRTSWRE